MVAAAVANERRAGTLDQLRTTPLSPLALAAGMVVGVPARLYLLCAGPLVLHVVAALAGPLPLQTALSSLAVLGAGSVASCALGLCVALAPRQESGGTFAALGVAALLGVFAFMTGVFAGDRHMVAWSFLHPAGALDAVMLQQHGLWRRMVVGPWGGHFDSQGYVTALPLVPLASVAASLVFGAILLRAACRKLAAPQLPLFSKRQAVALFAFAAATVVAPLVVSDHLGDFDANAAYGFSALLLPRAGRGRPLRHADVRGVGADRAQGRAPRLVERRRLGPSRRVADAGAVGGRRLRAARSSSHALLRRRRDAGARCGRRCWR